MLCCALAAPLAATAGTPTTGKCIHPPQSLDVRGYAESSIDESAGDADGWIGPDLSGDPLDPGETGQLTPGTNASVSPELVVSPPGFKGQGSFSFLGIAGGRNSGTYSQSCFTSTIDLHCKCHTQVTVTEGAIAMIRIHHYDDSQPLVADWRTDRSGHVRSDTASRTHVAKDGSTMIEFHFKTPVTATNVNSKWLLLNTVVDRMTTVNGLEFVAPDGSHSGLRPTFVPSTP
jgi:hypothetical protein